MIIWTSAVLSVLYACVLYLCICTCSVQLSMLDMERRSRNTLIIIIVFPQQVDHAAERYKILQSNAESYRKEIAALQDKCQKYNTSIAKHELTITKLKEVTFV